MGWKLFSGGREPVADEWTGFLDRGVKFEGTLEMEGTFRIDGRAKGRLVSQQTLVLGEGAQVEGQIEGNHVVIGGHFDGVIFAKARVEIQSNGVVSGEIHSPCLVIEPGAVFDGRCHVRGAAETDEVVTVPFRTARGGTG